MHLRLLAISLIFAAPFSAADNLYRVVGPDGKVSYTDRPPATASAQAVKVPGISSKSSSDYSPAEAVVKVLAMQGTVEHLTRFCNQYAPGSSRSVRDARDDWLVRNASLTAQRNKVARDLMTISELNHLAERMQDESTAKANLASQAAPAMKKTWCDMAPANFAAREMDPSRDLALTRVLMGYKFTKK